MIWGGSIVTGSASRPTTIASFGGAAAAPVTRLNATSKASAARWRVRMRGPSQGGVILTSKLEGAQGGEGVSRPAAAPAQRLVAAGPENNVRR